MRLCLYQGNNIDLIFNDIRILNFELPFQNSMSCLCILVIEGDQLITTNRPIDKGECFNGQAFIREALL
jgi:hypothetical protein